MRASLKRWIGGSPDISAVITRFPVAVAVMGVFTILLIIDPFTGNEPLGRMMAGLIVGAYLAFCITIAREAKGQSPAYLLQVVLAVIFAVIAWFSKELRFNIPMAIGAVLLILGNMVIWRKSRDDLHVWDFTHKVWTGAVFATVGSIIFFVGVLAIQAALKSLFGVNMNELTERLILPIGLGFLAPLYWLSTAPRTDESYQELHDNPGFVSKAVAFMGTWLLSPLTLIYALILIAYAIKIIMAGSLPKGEIAQLTTPFLLVGALTWLVLEPPFIRDKTLAKLFRKLWFPLSIPAALMLGISIGVRIREYGFTPERIALLMAVIWALGLGLWFTFGPKSKRDIRLVPGAAAILLLIGAFGAEALSVHNQKSRAISGLKSAGIMSDAGTIKSRNDINITDKEAAGKAKGSLAYLTKLGEEKILKSIFEGAENTPSFDKYDNAKLYKRLALDDIEISTGRYQSKATTYDGRDKMIPIAGYEKLYGPFSYHAMEKNRLRQLYTSDDLSLAAEGHTLKFMRDAETLAEFNIRAWVGKLDSSNQKYLLEDELIQVLKESDREIVIKVTSINRWMPDVKATDKESITLGFSVLTKGF